MDDLIYEHAFLLTITFLQFNHGSSGHEVEISYDEEGSCMVYATQDVQSGSPLRLSYGDYYLTNPSATFGMYLIHHIEVFMCPCVFGYSFPLL